jgi:7-cyano-7-deazaguanine synthase
MTEKPAAIVLLSGGLDSTTCLAIAAAEGFEPHALVMDYGQRHAVELRSALQVAEAFGIRNHVVARLDLRVFGQSALTSAIEVPKHDDVAEIGSEIPVTYVPARNTIFLSYALAHAEVVGARDIYIGVNALDYSGYPDCRPEYIEAFERMANMATRAGVEDAAHPLRIHAPLVHLTKAQIIARGHELGVDYGLTHSCYDPVGEDGLACGHCDSCLLRKKGFAEAGVPDPTRYAPGAVSP